MQTSDEERAWYQRLYPVETISVRLTNDRPNRDFANTDVAFIPVTRFNVRMNPDTNGRSAHLDGRHHYGAPGYDEFWLNRIDIFERVCLPSILNLIPRPDAWYIGFGELRPAYVRALFERLERYSWIVPYFRYWQDGVSLPPLAEMLAEHARSLGKAYVCSTRFDSDDSLHQQFYAVQDKTITHLRNRDLGEQSWCLNPLYGIVEAGGQLSVYLRRTNMFESVFEHVEKVEGPYRGPHDRIREQMPLVEIITNLPMWMYHRHDNNLDPPDAISADRLLLPLSEQYFEPFGLTCATGIAHPPVVRNTVISEQNESAVERPFTLRDRRNTAAGLRQSVYWNSEQRETAVDLARAMRQPTLAQWLRSMKPDRLDPGKILAEIEESNLRFLNAVEYAQLASICDDARRADWAVRFYDYALQCTPEDRHLYNARNELADSLHSAFDLDEQMELAEIEPPHGERTNLAIIVTVSVAQLEADGMLDALHERARQLAGAGVTTRVIQLPCADSGVDESGSFPMVIDGVSYEWLIVSEPLPRGADATRRLLVRQLGKYVACSNPSLLATDGSATAQVVTAAVARAFRIPAEL